MKSYAFITSVLLTALIAFNYVSAEANMQNFVTLKKLDLTIHTHFRNKFGWDESWPVAQKIEELTNIHLSSVTGNQDINSREIFNDVMTSGDLPDIVGGNSLKEEFNRYGMQGDLIPLNNLIEQYAPNISALLNLKPRVKSSITAPDGNIYYIPYVPSGTAGRGYYIREDWLDKLDLPVPTTVDEFHDTLIAFRDRDPNGNGLRDEIPYFNRHAEEVIRLVNLFGARSTGSDKYHDFVVTDDLVKHPYVDPAFKYGISQVALWYKEELIDQEIFTRKSIAR